jgi:hypothetical protein
MLEKLKRSLKKQGSSESVHSVSPKSSFFSDLKKGSRKKKEKKKKEKELGKEDATSPSITLGDDNGSSGILSPSSTAPSMGHVQAVSESPTSSNMSDDFLHWTNDEYQLGKFEPVPFSN